MKTVIIDDEKLARQNLISLLKDYPHIDLIAEAKNGFEAIEICQTLKPDLILLDIQMPGFNGFEVIQNLKEIPLVIFTTAFDEYTLKAFETPAVDYLLKPISKEKLNSAIEKIAYFRSKFNLITNILNQPESQITFQNKFAVKTGATWKLIYADEILYFFSKDKFTYLKTLNQELIYTSTLNDLEKKLEPNNFIRCHRSAIVHLKHINSVKKSGSSRMVLQMKNGDYLQTSRRYCRLIQERLNI